VHLASQLCSMLVLVLFATASVEARDRRPWSRVRCLDDTSADLLAHALDASPTVTRLVDSLESSDLIVMIRAGSPLSRLAAETQLLSATRGARYVLVEIRRFATEGELIGRLGHELQHANEIARAPEVRDAASLRALFARIGHPTAAVEDGYETEAAQEAGREVMREVAARRGGAEAN
jgi:hypothetical protein